MLKNPELIIANIMRDLGDTAAATNSIMNRLKEEDLSEHEKLTYIRFLIHAGLKKEVFVIYEILLTENFEIPLHEYIYAALKENIQIEPDHLNVLLEMNAMSSEINKIGYISSPPYNDPRLLHINEHFLQQSADMEQGAREKWIEQLEYFRAHRMLTEEEKLLKKLLDIFPSDEFLKKQWDTFKEYAARELIAQKTTELMDRSMHHLTQTPAEDPGQKKIADIIVTEMFRLASAKTKFAYNFAVGLYFMELFEASLKVLHLAKPSISRDWLEIELLLKTRRFVQCLDAVQTVDQKYQDDPETIFATTYYRAIALEAIGQKSYSLELIKSLVSVRPNYRTAHELTIKWSGGHK